MENRSDIIKTKKMHNDRRSDTSRQDYQAKGKLYV
jgi:hypothetical protein